MSKQNHFPTVAIFITAVSWAGFALWLGTNPGALLPSFGVEASTPQMLTEVRACAAWIRAGHVVLVI